MKRAVAVLFAVGLAGCNAGVGGAPDVRAQASPDFSASMQRYGADLKLARQHRLTYVAAAQRLRQGALSTPGAVLSDADSLLIAYIVAMSAEVDVGRMTPEMLLFKVQERTAQNHAEAKRTEEAEQDRQLQRQLATLRAIQAAQPAPVVDVPTYQTPALNPPPRLQTNCTSQALGTYTYTNCN